MNKETDTTYCPHCERKDCYMREKHQRLPREQGGLGLCPRLTKNVKGVKL